MKKRSSSRPQSSNSRRTTGKSAGGQRQARGRAAQLNPRWLQNFFSEMLAVEHGGIQLYERALEELMHDDLRPKLEQFHQQTQRHVELCQEMLNAAGGNEDEMAPAAEAAEHKAQGLLSAEVPEEMKDINNLENLVLAETKDHWNWELLGSLMDKVEGRDLKRVVSRAVREVRRQENDHLTWSQKMLTRLATEAAQKMPEMEEDSEEDEKEAGAEQDY
jgi:rubrerythrin